jgi:hypothetical protein
MGALVWPGRNVNRSGGPLPVWLVAIPVVWAGIGATAAVLLNVPEDLGLLVCGVLSAALLPIGGHGRIDLLPECS